MKSFKNYNIFRLVALNLGILMLIYLGFSFGQADFNIGNWIDAYREACAITFFAGILAAFGIENEFK